MCEGDGQWSMVNGEWSMVNCRRRKTQEQQARANKNPATGNL
jgi:hypothetical protein